MMMSIGTNHLKREKAKGRLSFQKSYNLIIATQTGPSPSPEGKPLKNHLKTPLCSAVSPPARKSYLEAFNLLSPCDTLYVCEPFKLFCKKPYPNKVGLFSLCLQSGELLLQQVVQLSMSRCVGETVGTEQSASIMCAFWWGYFGLCLAWSCGTLADGEHQVLLGHIFWFNVIWQDTLCVL